MGSKLTEMMVISFALLLFIFTIDSFADNISSNNSNISQSKFVDDRLIPGNESQMQANSTSENPGRTYLDAFKGMNISSILNDGANLLTILAILAGLFLWLIRNKIIRIFKLERFLNNDVEAKKNTTNSEKEAPKSLFKLHASSTSGGCAQRSPRRFLMTMLELLRTSNCRDGT
jgi:hypothetical protein